MIHPRNGHVGGDDARDGRTSGSLTAPGVGAITACRSLRSSTSLKERSRDDRDATIDRLRTKVCELTVDTKLLQAKTQRLEAGAAGTDADADLGARSGRRS